MKDRRIIINYQGKIQKEKMFVNNNFVRKRNIKLFTPDSKNINAQWVYN